MWHSSSNAAAAAWLIMYKSDVVIKGCWNETVFSLVILAVYAGLMCARGNLILLVEDLLRAIATKGSRFLLNKSECPQVCQMYLELTSQRNCPGNPRTG